MGCKSPSALKKALCHSRGCLAEPEWEEKDINTKEATCHGVLGLRGEASHRKSESEWDENDNLDWGANA